VNFARSWMNDLPTVLGCRAQSLLHTESQLDLALKGEKPVFCLVMGGMMGMQFTISVSDKT
jgi:hypothetical protein